MTYTEIVLQFAAAREKHRQDVAGMRWILGLNLLLWSVVAWAAWTWLVT